jgi:4'-phosphopantetheinyl transferase
MNNLGQSVGVAAGITLMVDTAPAAIRGWEPTEDDLRASAHLASWRAQEFLAARCLLRRMLADALGPVAAALTIMKRDSGQPYLSGAEHIGVSLSHDRGLVAAAISVHGPVGVDTQHPTPVSARMMLRCCSCPDVKTLIALPMRERMRECAWIWSVQEACVKAAGLGIAGRPWSVQVSPGQCAGQWAGHSWRSLRDESQIPVSCAYRSWTGKDPAGSGEAAQLRLSRDG